MKSCKLSDAFGVIMCVVFCAIIGLTIAIASRSGFQSPNLPKDTLEEVESTDILDDRYQDLEPVQEEAEYSFTDIFGYLVDGPDFLACNNESSSSQFQYFVSFKTHQRRIAKKYCHSRNGSLASVGSKEKYDSLIDFIKCVIKERDHPNRNEVMWTSMVYSPMHDEQVRFPNGSIGYAHWWKMKFPTYPTFHTFKTYVVMKAYVEEDGAVFHGMLNFSHKSMLYALCERKKETTNDYDYMGSMVWARWFQ